MSSIFYWYVSIPLHGYKPFNVANFAVGYNTPLLPEEVCKQFKKSPNIGPFKDISYDYLNMSLKESKELLSIMTIDSNKARVKEMISGFQKNLEFFKKMERYKPVYQVKYYNRMWYSIQVDGGVQYNIGSYGSFEAAVAGAHRLNMQELKALA